MAPRPHHPEGHAAPPVRASTGHRFAAWGVLVCLASSALTLALAPLLMPDSYSWIANSTSESAAQGVDGAWLARMGFLLLGFGVLWLATLGPLAWRRSATALHMAFGVSLIANAAFATRSWDASAQFDGTEDLLHSLASAATGFAFTLGVLAVLLRRAREQSRPWIVEMLAITVVVVLLFGMGIWDDAEGVLQRGIFLTAYVWYGIEAWRLIDARSKQDSRTGSSTTAHAPGSP